MKRLLIIFIALAMLLAACRAEPAQVAEAPDDVDIAQEENQERPPEPDTEPGVWPPLSDAAQRIVDSGELSGESIDITGAIAFTTYVNMVLGFVYHFDETSEDEDGRFFVRIGRPVEFSSMLMSATGMGDQFVMRVFDGCGEEWVRSQAAYVLESHILAIRSDLELIRELDGDEYEENLAERIARRDEFRELNRVLLGEYYEEIFHFLVPEELEDMEFWAVEYETAGIIFTGLQINFTIPIVGSNAGITYLFTQIYDDVAVVIYIYSREFAGAVARRHLGRFEAIS